MTLEFNRVRAVIKENVHAKLHRAKCSYRAYREKTQTKTIQSVATAQTVTSAVKVLAPRHNTCTHTATVEVKVGYLL